MGAVALYVKSQTSGCIYVYKGILIVGATARGKPTLGVGFRCGKRRKPGSVSTVISLGWLSPTTSSVPTSGATGSGQPSLLGLRDLHRMGFAELPLLPEGLVRSYRTVSPLPDAPRGAPGGLLSVALSVGLPRPAVSWHPALWCPDFPQAWPPATVPSSHGSILAPPPIPSSGAPPPAAPALLGRQVPALWWPAPPQP